MLANFVPKLANAQIYDLHKVALKWVKSMLVLGLAIWNYKLICTYKVNWISIEGNSIIVYKQSYKKTMQENFLQVYNMF